MWKAEQPRNNWKSLLFSRVKNVQGQQILVIVIAEEKKKGMDGILNDVP